MANAFSKEERVAFELLLEGFHDQLVLSRNVSIYNTDQVTMERTSDTIWRPMPYISQSFDGQDQTSNFKDYTQLSVPARIGFAKSVPWTLTARCSRSARTRGTCGTTTGRCSRRIESARRSSSTRSSSPRPARRF